jgi:MFS family permease
VSQAPLSAFRASINLLWTRRFGTFWFACLLSNIGTWAQQVAQPWLLLSLGASSFLIGLDSFALGAPVWLLTLVGGALADHADRRRVITKFQSIQMLCPTLIVVLLLAATVQPWMIILLSLVVGVTDALSMPSFQSIVPSIVERKDIASGLALNSTQFNLSRILGPSIAGILLVSVGAVGCFAVSAVSYIPFIAVALWILPRRETAPVQDGNVYDRRRIIADARKIMRMPYLRGGYLTVFSSSLLCAPLVTFTPILIKNAFHGDAGHFSVAVGAFGVGGLVGAIGLLFVKAGYDRRRLSSWFAGLYAIVLMLAAFNPWFWVLPALLVAGGVAMSVSNISTNTLLQANTPAELRGQTVSLYMLAMRGGLSIGSLLTGISVSLLGVGHALLINGAIAMTAQIFIGRAWHQSALPAQQ